MSALRTASLAVPLLVPCVQAQDVSLFPMVPAEITGGERYGASVDLDGAVAAIGATFFEDPAFGTVGEGAVFLVDTETGSVLHKLLHTPFVSVEQLGRAVAIDGGRVLATIDPASSLEKAFVFDVSTGQELMELIPVTGGAHQDFGNSADLAGGVAIVGDRFWRPSLFVSSGKGAAYAFDVATGQQLYEFEETSNADIGWLGEAVATDGLRALCGAPRTDEGGTDRGAAYLYELAGGTRIQKLLPAGLLPGDQFGGSVALGDGYAAVGAAGDDELGSFAGKVYVFDAVTGALVRIHTASDGVAGHAFGASVRVDGGLLYVGASGLSAAQAGKGAVYVYDLVSGAELYALKDAAPVPEPVLGGVLAVSGGRLLHGNSGDDTLGMNAGTAKYFELPRALFGAPGSVSASAGGTQSLALVGWPVQEGNTYLLLGSLSGTSPGTPTGAAPGAPVLPLAFDGYLAYTLGSAGSGAPPLAGALGLFDSTGAAAAGFSLPPLSPPSLAGLTAHHAFAVIDFTPLPGQPMIDAVSGAVAVSLVP